MSRFRHTSASPLRALRGAAVVAALVLGASCAADSDDAPAAGATVPASAPASQSEALPLVGGGSLDLSVIDDQPIALWFWAPG